MLLEESGLTREELLSLGLDSAEMDRQLMELQNYQSQSTHSSAKAGRAASSNDSEGWTTQLSGGRTMPQEEYEALQKQNDSGGGRKYGNRQSRGSYVSGGLRELSSRRGPLRGSRGRRGRGRGSRGRDV